MQTPISLHYLDKKSTFTLEAEESNICTESDLCKKKAPNLELVMVTAHWYIHIVGLHFLDI